MANDRDIHPNAPAGGGGLGAFASPAPMGMNPGMDRWNRPGTLGLYDEKFAEQLKIDGVIAAGGPLSNGTVMAVNRAAMKTPPQWRRYIAYAEKVKVGGSLAWRANNPGNLRGAPTKIASVSGAAGKFAVFASIDEGRSAQRDLYLEKYGAMSVRDAVNKLTPPSENDTAKYLSELKRAGVDLDGNVASQIDVLMKGVEANEGLIKGIEVDRIP